MIPGSLDTYRIRTDGPEVTSTPTSADNFELNGQTANLAIELIFLGTGTSTSVPHVDCLTAPPSREPCRTCLSTLTPDGKKNIRRNTSAVVRVTGEDGKKTTLVIDVGKNFQAAAAEWFPKYGLREIDAVLITHAHADAMNGLDDLRGWTLEGAIQKHIDIYLSQATFSDVQRAFPYLVFKEFASGGGDIPEFRWRIIEDKVPFEINDTGIRIIPFLVHHGRLFTDVPPPTFIPTPFATQATTPISGRSSPVGTLSDEGAAPKIHPFLCFGFLLQDTIVYMSDVSLIPEDAWQVIQAGGRKSVLVIDCLRLYGHTSHMGVQEAGGAIRMIGARRSYMTGFNHDVSHEEYVRIGEGVQADGQAGEEDDTVSEGIELMRAGLEGEAHWVRPAHDGLRVHVRDGGVWDDTYT